MTMIDIHFVSTAQQIRRGLKQPRKQKHQSFFSVSRMKQHRKRMMAGVDFNVLRNEITMQDVLDQLRFRPTTRSGDQLHGPCPVHGSKSPGSRTFSVNLEKARYYCHKCHSHGNQLELWAAVNKQSIYEAAISLCSALNRDVPRIERS